jgi:hypothetical protein
VNKAEEVILQGIYKSLEQVIDTTQETAVPGIISQAMLFKINYKEQGKKAKKPFNSHIEPGLF